jgi:hypothetical protein
VDTELGHVGGGHREIYCTFDLGLDRFANRLPGVAAFDLFLANSEHPTDDIESSADKREPGQKGLLIPCFLFQRGVLTDSAPEPLPNDRARLVAFELIEHHNPNDSAMSHHRLRGFAVTTANVGHTFLNVDRTTARRTLEASQNPLLRSWRFGVYHHVAIV